MPAMPAAPAGPAVQAASWLREASRGVRPGPPVATTYRPLEYAWEVHEEYLRRYGAGRKRALLVGMNPGPWGMGQTGVPFGDVGLVGDWLRLRGLPVRHPRDERKDRPVLGWACERGEGSGRRLWGLLRDTFGTPDRALRDLLVVNHCPLLMFTAEGGNVTPDKLRRVDRDPVLRVSDEGLARIAEAAGARVLIGIGRYAEARCRAVGELPGLETLAIPHPSPANPAANRGGGSPWRRQVLATLREAGVAT